jgi:hypothetical protein
MGKEQKKSFEHWNQNMEQVYSKFRKLSQKVPEQGFENVIPENTSGYYLLFRLPEPTRSDLSHLSERISQIAPAIVYTSAMLHLTVSDFGIKPSSEFQYDSDLLGNVEGIVKTKIKERDSPKIKLEGILYNPNTVIIEGHSDSNFYELTMKIIERCKEEGINLREPWGSHVTVSRFSGKSDPTNFLRLVNDFPGMNTQIELSDLELGSFKWIGFDLYWKAFQRFCVNQ